MNGQNCCKDGHNCGPTKHLPVNHNPVAAAVTSHRHQIVGKNRGEESLAKSGRAFSSTAPQINNKTYLWARYNEMKRLVHDLIPPGVCNLLNPSTIYANNEVNLEEVDIYGFDYDYTLALYSSALDEMIYNKAREFLVQHYKYPEGISKYDYIPNFATRGLHYDIQKGLLMKIDAFHYIQLGTVYRGLKPVPDDEVMKLYGGSNHVPLHQVSGFYGKGPKMKQFMDVFSIPEMTLLAAANDYFISNDVEYDPVHLYKDVSDAIGMVHIKGYMYKWIMQDLEKYILRGDETYAVLHRLASHGKKLFLITNSPFSFVDKGMKYMVGKEWREFFDVVIVQADKPHFFNDCVKPFRRLDSNGDLQWDRIKSLNKGQIYKQVTQVCFVLHHICLLLIIILKEYRQMRRNIHFQQPLRILECMLIWCQETFLVIVKQLHIFEETLIHCHSEVWEFLRNVMLLFSKEIKWIKIDSKVLYNVTKYFYLNKCFSFKVLFKSLSKNPKNVNIFTNSSTSCRVAYTPILLYRLKSFPFNYMI
uniref:5'-nucleotidase domain-containing protein 2-like n=1 Tax=Sinocyclocheilus grahami TaxID=75366 RepID=A0A672PEH0_SINGR